MNICKCFKCDTCDTLIDCRIGMSNRDVQPFQFACPSCEDVISFAIGTSDGELKGATDIVDFKSPFDGTNPFVDLHLDFPVSFEKYEMGNTAYMRAVTELKENSLGHLTHQLHLLNTLHSKQRDLQRLITQYKRGDIKNFEKICTSIPEVKLKSTKSQDVLAALYSATSVMSSPFTIHEHNKELSEKMPQMLQGLYNSEHDQIIEFSNQITGNGFLKNLHHDCLSLYPKIIALDLPLRPALYYDYIDSDKLGKIPARVSISDFDTCNNYYKDLAEVFSRQLILVAGLNNLVKRKNFNLFDNSIRLNKKGDPIRDFSSLDNYANVDLGRKVSAIDDSFFAIDTNAIDNKLRNGIAHYKYEYKESSQLITYYPSKEGMQREKYYSLYFIEFMRKTLLLFREVHSMNHIIKSLLYFRILVLGKNI
jgi:hypothetical protein